LFDFISISYSVRLKNASDWGYFILLAGITGKKRKTVGLGFCVAQSGRMKKGLISSEQVQITFNTRFATSCHILRSSTRVGVFFLQE